MTILLFSGPVPRENSGKIWEINQNYIYNIINDLQSLKLLLTSLVLCLVLIHLSPALSTVDEDGAGRPAKVDVSDLSEERSKTGNLNFIGLHNVVCWSKYTTL